MNEWMASELVLAKSDFLKAKQVGLKLQAKARLFHVDVGLQQLTQFTYFNFLIRAQRPIERV